MAFAATISSSEGRAIPMGGPLKYEVYTITAVSGDTSGSITSKNLHTIYHVLLDGLKHTAAPTFSSNVVTLAFADPAANAFGSAIVIGI